MIPKVRQLSLALGALLLTPTLVWAQFTATTSLSLSVCGNSVVEGSEQCDVPGETGAYSQTILGRQCTPICRFGPYCGDGILQTQFGEECDDGNNDDGDFCSSICRIEPAGSGGGGSSGGGSGGRGGQDTPLGDTQISVTGIGYPGRTINFLLDTESVGSVRASRDGRFEFATDANPGTATLGIWALDAEGTRSITLNNTFDVTQGAVTNVNGVILPPTIRVPNPQVNPGDVVTFSGQSVPNATIELHVNNSELVEMIETNAEGIWQLALDTSRLRVAEHTVRARSITGNPPLTVQSGFSSALQLFVGVDGQVTTPSDLNRDGRVDLIDFSILIFWWNTNGGESDPPADINGNGRVSIEDFSILLFNWTGS
jgi:cysteine-rich repeat protein